MALKLISQASLTMLKTTTAGEIRFDPDTICIESRERTIQRTTPVKKPSRNHRWIYSEHMQLENVDNRQEFSTSRQLKVKLENLQTGLLIQDDPSESSLN